MSSRRILVTAALPYANGPIHIGHMVEYIQTDIWVRFQKLRGHRCVFVCADDTHGTAIMISAKKAGVSEEEFIARVKDEHTSDFSRFDVEFDNYESTNSDENRELCAELWQAIRAAGMVIEKDVEQLYDPEVGTFLADRFVKGTCPFCKLENQYGDSCDNGHTYSPSEMIDAVSTLSGAKPELRTANHLFIELERLHDFLEEWSQSGEHLQAEVANYLKGHFLGDPNSEEGRKPLRDWDISRPAPYFGFEIPDSPGNYWYVWFDAPIGYMASTKQWCDTEIHHFIGKDITYFHTLFWPGMLKTARFELPTKVHIHGFLTVAGEKMSKSKGTFVKAATYLNHLDPAWLRYYYASKLGPKLDDLDLGLEEFVNKINADLVGKVVNLASRTAKFIAGQNLAETYPDDGELFTKAAAAGERIAELYEGCDYNAAMREIMQLADRANKYVEDHEPWKLRKDAEKAEELRGICTVSLNLFRQIAIYLSPVLPKLAAQTAELLNDPIGPGDWDKVQQPLLGTPVGQFQHMMKRVEEKQVHAMIEESKEAQADESADEPSPWNDGPEALAAEPMTEECTIDDFVKVDMRVARVVAAQHVEGADKLLQLTLSLGGDERCNVFAGVKNAYDPEPLVGRLVICCANLKPRKMRFGISEGMVLASGTGGKDIFLLSPDEGSVPGQRVH